MNEKPVEALAGKPDDSIFRCWQLMAGKKVDGLVWAGNTGAVVAGGLHDPAVPQVRPAARHRRRHADRQGPVRHHRRRRQRLPASRPPVQYGVMGAVFASTSSARTTPRSA